MKGSKIIDDPIGTGGEEVGVGGGGAKRERAGPGGFAGSCAGGSIFRDDAKLRMEMKGGGTCEVGLGIGLAAGDVAGRDEVLDVRPEPGGAQANLGESAGRGSDHSELRGRDGGEKFPSSRKSDDIVDVFDFSAFHPFVLGEVNGGIGVGEKFPDGGEARAAMGGGDRVIGIEVVLAGPARPDASNGGSGVDEDAVHVEEEALASDGGHKSIVRRIGRTEKGERFDLVYRLSLVYFL